VGLDQPNDPFETRLARIPAKWNHFAEKDSRQINTLEQILIAKVFNFGGICYMSSGMAESSARTSSSRNSTDHSMIGIYHFCNIL